jgi:hypothetical protein
LVVLAASWLPGGAKAQSLEYEVKAAFLYNFAQFTTWPGAAFAAPDEPFHLCVAGTDPFGTLLDNAVQGESVASRPIRITRLGTASPQIACHLLFVADDAVARLPALAKTHVRALLVGEANDFLSRGGVINFVVEAGRVRFDVNTEAAARRGLKFSSRLLRIARLAAPGAQR